MVCNKKTLHYFQTGRQKYHMKFGGLLTLLFPKFFYTLCRHFQKKKKADIIFNSSAFY